MESVDTLFNIDWKGAIYTTFLIMVSIIAICRVTKDFGGLVKSAYYKIKGINPKPKNDQQDIEIDNIKLRQDSLEESLNLIKENVMIATWDRIVHFGMNYIERGHISYAEKDIFMAQTRSYSRCGGNGHLIGFVPRVEELPYTEDLTYEEIKTIETDEPAKHKRVALAKASLSAYYGK